MANRNPQDLADTITDRAAAALAPLERSMRGWPAEFRAVVWHAVKLTAEQNQLEAEQAKKRGE